MVGKYQQPALDRGVHRRARVHRGPARRAPPARAAADGDRLPRQGGEDAGLQLPAQARLERSHPLRRAREARAGAAGEAASAAARGAFMALGCRDVARIDFRMDDKGRIYFIECNPLPGLTPGWSDLVLIAQGAGMDYRTLIGEIMAPRHPPLQGARGPPRRGRARATPRPCWRSRPRRSPRRRTSPAGGNGNGRAVTPAESRAAAPRRQGLSPQGTSRPSPKPSTQNSGFGSARASQRPCAAR